MVDENINGNAPFEFEDIDLTSFNIARARDGNATMKLIEAFLATGKYATAVKLSGDLSAKRAISITQTARHYVKPVRAIYRDGKMVLKRVDVTQDGNAIVGWEQGEEFLGDPNRREAAARAGATRREALAAAKAASAQRTEDGANATREMAGTGRSRS